MSQVPVPALYRKALVAAAVAALAALAAALADGDGWAPALAVAAAAALIAGFTTYWVPNRMSAEELRARLAKLTGPEAPVASPAGDGTPA